MADFSIDIKNFEAYGTYTYVTDSVGNFLFNSSSINFSQVYFSFPIINFNYNNTKISTFNNPSFTEFIPTSITSSSSGSVTQSISDVQQQLSSVTQQNVQLTSQLNTFLSQSTQDSSSATVLATQQVILELRMMLGQGRVASDFSQDFPYTPVIKTTS